MKTFEESDRLNLPLTADSVVLDIGAHEGWFTGELWNKFGCHIYAFEPIARFRAKLEERFRGNKKVVIFPSGLGAYTRSVPMGIKGDMTGAYCTEPNESERVLIEDVVRYITPSGGDMVDLAAINCEGGEYEILERLISSGAIKKIRHLSVQMHTVVPDYEARCASLFSRLKETHDHVYGSPFVWDGFTLR